ncbi:MAG: hypothetical protein EBZ93_12065, partial [Actinobacteria bacterium]|nr:hypothetical protein [Actinomycetota bacterium]
ADCALITDGRFSGGTWGFCIGHVAPEAVDGGPIAFVRDGDRIRIDVASHGLDLLVDDAELARRRQGWTANPPRYTSGVLGKYAFSTGADICARTATSRYRMDGQTSRPCRFAHRRCPMVRSCSPHAGASSSTA